MDVTLDIMDVTLIISQNLEEKSIIGQKKLMLSCFFRRLTYKVVAYIFKDSIISP